MTEAGLQRLKTRAAAGDTRALIVWYYRDMPTFIQALLGRRK